MIPSILYSVQMLVRNNHAVDVSMIIFEVLGIFLVRSSSDDIFHADI